MAYAWRTLAGVTAALTLAACQGDAQAEDEMATPLASVQASTASDARAPDDEALELADARCDWRCVVALGVVSGQLTDAIEQFGGLIESLPRPNPIQCWTAGDDDWLLKLRCAYWSLKDDAEKDADADSDERSSSGTTKPSGGTTKPSGSSGTSKPTQSGDASSSDRGSAGSTGTRDDDRPGLGG